MADKLKLLANLLPFATDLQNSALLWTWMSPYYTEHLLSKVGELLFFNPLRPVRRWRMNLAHDHDRVIAKRLQQISVGEKKRREAAGLPDTSQHGDGEMFRNVFYTGKGAAIFSGRSAPVGG